MNEHIVRGSQRGSPGWAYSHLTGESFTVVDNFIYDVSFFPSRDRRNNVSRRMGEFQFDDLSPTGSSQHSTRISLSPLIHTLIP